MTILLGTAEGLRAVSDGPVALDGRQVTAVAATGNGWLAVIEQHTVVDDSGRIEAEVPGSAVTCVTAWDGNALVGTDDAGLVRVDAGRASPVAGFTDAEGRSTWYTPWGGPPATRSVTIAPGGTPYVNVHVGGVLRSQDDGRSWKQTLDIDVDVHQVVADPSGVLLAACGAEGLAISHDGGDSWRFDTAGLHATYCRAVVAAGQTVLLSASLGPWGGRAAVYRRPLGTDDAFEQCTVGLPAWFDANIDTHLLAGRGDLAAFASEHGTVFVSEDAGVSWAEADRATGIAAIAIT
jgi:hypothetical protein